MSASVYKLTGRLASGIETSLILKLRESGGFRQNQHGSRSEIMFYRDIAANAGVASPIAYVAEFDDRNGRMLLITELLDERTVGTIKTYISITETTRILRALAGMHAKLWNAPALSNAVNHWQLRTFEQAFGSGAKLFRSGVYSGRRFLQQHGDRTHPKVAKHYESSDKWGGKLISSFSNNRTLCHYDVAPKNLSLPLDPSHPPVFFDWSLVIAGSIGVELAQTLAYSLALDDHHRIPELLDSYLAAMNELGITDLTKDILLSDVRCGLLTRLAAPIALTSRGYEPANELALELLPRITSAVLATDAFEVLE